MRDEEHRVELEVSHRTPERTYYRVWFRGEVLLTHHDPEHAACRALLERGITGRLIAKWRGAEHDASMRDIETSSTLCAQETRKSGPRTVKFVEFDRVDLASPAQMPIAARPFRRQRPNRGRLGLG